MLVLSAQDVRASLPMRDAIELMKQAFVALAAGDAAVPLRTHLSAPDDGGITLVMPSRVDGACPSLAVKVVSVFGGNSGLGLPTIHAAVVVLDPATGRPLALLEGSSLTAIRTAAAAGAATDLLARPAGGQLAVLGAGVQARAHIAAMCSVRAIRRIRVFDPLPEKADELVAELGASGSYPPISRAGSAADAVGEADIICTTTTSATPVFEDGDLRPGTHINAMGAYTPQTREIEGATVARAWVVVDDRTAAWTEAGDLIQARDEGLITEDHVRADLGEVATDPDLRPDNPNQVTLFKSVGIAVQDAVAASAALEGARRLGLGAEVEW